MATAFPSEGLEAAVLVLICSLNLRRMMKRL
jgi:hypothetical protein